jgi:ankyrin repeat protein
LLAAQNGHRQVVKMLLDKGADVNAQGEGYGNALQAASSGGHEAVVKMLLNKGANILVNERAGSLTLAPILERLAKAPYSHTTTQPQV